MEGYKITTEYKFWEFISDNNAECQKLMEFDHLKFSGKIGFYAPENEIPFGIVTRILSDYQYYIKIDANQASKEQ